MAIWHHEFAFAFTDRSARLTSASTIENQPIQLLAHRFHVGIGKGGVDGDDVVRVRAGLVQRVELPLGHFTGWALGAAGAVVALRAGRSRGAAGITLRALDSGWPLRSVAALRAGVAVVPAWDVEGEAHVRSIKAHAHGGRLAAIASDEAHWLLSGWELVSNCPSTTKTAQAVARETQSLRFEAPHFAF